MWVFQEKHSSLENIYGSGRQRYLSLKCFKGNVYTQTWVQPKKKKRWKRKSVELQLICKEWWPSKYMHKTPRKCYKNIAWLQSQWFTSSLMNEIEEQIAAIKAYNSNTIRPEHPLLKGVSNWHAFLNSDH